MKKILYSSVGSALLVGLMASPALADVTVTASLFKTKFVAVDVDITKDKTVLLSADVAVTPDSAAEALALANITNSGNLVEQSLNQGVPLHEDFDIYRRAVIDTSVNDNAGVVELNQDVGNMANQGNILAFAAAFNGTEPTTPDHTAFVEAEAWVDQVNTENRAVHLENGPDVSGPGGEPDAPAFNPNAGDGNVVASISGSINGNGGIVGVNQNAGNMPNQTNAVALAVGFGAVVALTEAALGQENSNNSVLQSGVVKKASMVDSVNGNVGVVHVNQSAGNMANQSNTFALAFATGGP